jgi:hypothetical protein
MPLKGSAHREAQPVPERKSDMQRQALDVVKTEAEIMKLMAETQKLNLEMRWMPFVWASGLIGVALTISKFLLH